MILTSKFKGKTVLVKQINFKDPYISHKLENIGLVPGAIIKVLDYNQSNKLLHLDIYNVEYVLRTEDCKYIDVEEAK